MNIVVGCPIRNRAWIFQEWVEAVQVAFEVAGEKPTWAFEVGIDPNLTDDGTIEMVEGLLLAGEPVHYAVRTEVPIPAERKPWNGQRYLQIVEARNHLLRTVRNLEPDLFFSVDSDILLHPTALLVLLDSIQKFDAVSGKAYLGMHRNFVTYAFHKTNGGLQRQDQDGVFPVEIIMALKLMKPAAYNVDYEYNQFGEDIGWSDSCRAKGLTLGFDGRVCSKHCMYREDLHKIDNRLGW